MVVMTTVWMLTCAGRAAVQTIVSATSSWCEWRDALVDLAGALLVAAEADKAEVGFDHAGIDRSDTHGGAEQIELQARADGPFGVLGGAVDRAVGVGHPACRGSEVDDVPARARDHSRDDGAGAIEQAFDVGVDHLVPVVGVVFPDFCKTAAEPGVVHEDVDVGPLGRERGERLFHLFALGHVELEEQDAVGPGFHERCSSSSSISRRRAHRRRRAPSAAKANAVARPIPELAPVTRTILPAREFILSLYPRAENAVCDIGHQS